MPANKSFPDKAAKLWWQVGSAALLAPGEAVRAVARMDRRALGWATLALAAILLLCVNLISSLLLRNARIDLTADKLFTIAEGTKRVLAKVDEPISVRVYYSRRLGEVAPVFGKYFERVKALLEQYRDISRGKVQVTFIEPEPFSDAEDRAVAAGLKGVRLNQDGETGYFGLVASNTTDNDQVIEFFALDRERFVEYDLTKLINGLANPKKKVVGLVTGLPLDGGANPMNPMMRQPQQPWLIMEQIREFFEVKTIEQTAKALPADLDVLMVVQPTLLQPDLAYAIDQYALAGGRILFFVDPHTETSPSGHPSMPLPMSKEVARLLKAWGLSYDEQKIAGDRSLARRVQFGGRSTGGAIVTEYLGWINIDKAQINEKDPLAAGIEKLQLATAGALVKVDGATTIITPVIETTPRAGLIDVERVRFQPNPITILNTFRPGNNPLTLAARVGGEAKSAFPDGRPKPEVKPEEKKDAKAGEAGPAAPASEKKADDAKPAEAKPAEAKPGEAKPGDAAAGDGKTGGDGKAADAKAEPKAGESKGAEATKGAEPKAGDTKAGDTAGAKGAEPKAGEPKAADTKAADAKPADAKAAAPKAGEAKPEAKEEKPHIASGRVNIVVVADADMLHDSFWVEVRDFLGQQVAIPQSHNAAFVVNALENLSGGEALAGLRGRGISERPFEKVVEIRRDSEQRFRLKEEALVAKLKDLQEKLAKLETKGGEGGGPVTVLLNDKEKQAVETFKGEMLQVRGELRAVKAALRRDIDQLDRWLKIVNIAAVPLLIGLGGLVFGIVQRRRRLVG